MRPKEKEIIYTDFTDDGNVVCDICEHEIPYTEVKRLPREYSFEHGSEYRSIYTSVVCPMCGATITISANLSALFDEEE